MSNDIRVLLVKLADRLHNMQTLRFIPSEEKRRRIALETMEIYAPLAERMGMHQLKDELENLAFAEINPDAYASIVQRLTFLREQGIDLSNQIMQELSKVLADAGVDGTVSGREKTPYSIWRKMQHKRMEFEQLPDIMAFRIMVEDISQCYQALGAARALFDDPGRFKIHRTPSLTDTLDSHRLLGPLRHRIEAQIRTREMHEVAELGVAAHWKYKQGAARLDGRQYRWLRELLDILEHASGPEEFLEHTKLEMFQDQVFCFTPKGDLIALPRGATRSISLMPCIARSATLRRRQINPIVPLRSELQNGTRSRSDLARNALAPGRDSSSPARRGPASAASFAPAALAVSRLRRAMMQKEFQHAGYDYADKSLEGVLRKYKVEEPRICWPRSGGRCRCQGTAEHHLSRQSPAPARRWFRSASQAESGRSAPGAIPIKGLIPGMAVHIAGCCHPLPGDRIVGIVTTGKGVTIHTIDCDTLESFADTPERWLDVAWENSGDGPGQHVGRLNVVITNQPGSLGSLTTVIGKNLGNISNLKITNRSIDFFEVMVDVEVSDLKHLTNIVAALRATPAISSVERARA
jgi:GTP pyrophosphokinase